MTLARLIKPLAIAVAIAATPAASAQMIIVRPEPGKVVKPKMAPVATVAQIEQKVKESNERKEKRTKARRRVTAVRPKASQPTLPPLEFTAQSSAGQQGSEPAKGLDLTLFAGPRPESQADRLAASSTSPRKVGDLTLNIPDCITIFEEGPDFFTGNLENQLEIEAWQFDPSYKLSTPAAYTRYIEHLYGGLEENRTDGNRTVLSGFDTRSGRNYHVTMVTDGDKLYVTRIIYKPALERPMSQSVIPSLLN